MDSPQIEGSTKKQASQQATRKKEKKTREQRPIIAQTYSPPRRITRRNLHPKKEKNLPPITEREREREAT